MVIKELHYFYNNYFISHLIWIDNYFFFILLLLWKSDILFIFLNVHFHFFGTHNQLLNFLTRTEIIQYLHPSV